MLFNGLGNPPKLSLHVAGSGLPLNTWVLGPTRVISQYSTSISSAVFAGNIHVTKNRQTDRQTTLRVTSVAAVHIYAMYVMRPKK